VGLAGLALVVLAGFDARFENGPARVIGPIPDAIDRIIPPGACVLTDQVSVTLAANRFISDVPGCPLMVDSVGTNLALSDGLGPLAGAGNVPAVAAAWNQAFSHAQYVILTPANARRIAWTPALTAYLNAHFARVYESPGKLLLYARIGLAITYMPQRSTQPAERGAAGRS
jgi:hypothetical protein